MTSPDLVKGGRGVLWAIGIVAQHVIASRAESMEDQWENYPEIGENDWEAVVQHVAELHVYPSEEDFKEAYALLESRAESTEQ